MVLLWACKQFLGRTWCIFRKHSPALVWNRKTSQLCNGRQGKPKHGRPKEGLRPRIRAGITLHPLFLGPNSPPQNQRGQAMFPMFFFWGGNRGSCPLTHMLRSLALGMWRCFWPKHGSRVMAHLHNARARATIVFFSPSKRRF